MRQITKVAVIPKQTEFEAHVILIDSHELHLTWFNVVDGTGTVEKAWLKTLRDTDAWWGYAAKILNKRGML